MTSSIVGGMDDNREPDIPVCRDDLRGMPRAGEAFDILIPVAKRYYHLVQMEEPELDNRTHFTNFYGSVDCAMRVVERQDHVGTVDVDALVAKIDLPCIANTLPLLIEAFEQCRSLWEGMRSPEMPEGRPQPDLTNTFGVLAYIGSKMYPICGTYSIMSDYSDPFA